MNKSLLIIAVLVIAGVGVGYSVVSQRTATMQDDAMTVQESPVPEGGDAMVGGSGPAVMNEDAGDNMSDEASESQGTMSTDAMTAKKSFTLEGSNYKFTPNTITVKKGDTVSVTMTSAQGMHDFVVDEFNARTKVVQPGESDTVTFTADKAGTYEFYCSVGNHRAMGMVGTLTVTE